MGDIELAIYILVTSLDNTSSSSGHPQEPRHKRCCYLICYTLQVIGILIGNESRHVNIMIHTLCYNENLLL